MGYTIFIVVSVLLPTGAWIMLRADTLQRRYGDHPPGSQILLLIGVAVALVFACGYGGTYVWRNLIIGQ